MKPFSTQPLPEHIGSAVNANVVLNLPALGGGIQPLDGRAYVLGGVAWSYSGGAPIGGRLTIENGAGDIVFDIDITAEGPDSIMFSPYLRGSLNTAFIITLFAAGGGVKGKVNAIGLHTQG